MMISIECQSLIVSRVTEKKESPNLQPAREFRFIFQPDIVSRMSKIGTIM